MLTIVAPGQGAQTPGFLSAWLEDATLAGELERWSELAELDLRALGTEGDAETIRDTAVAQPLLVAAGLLAHRALFGAEPQAATADLLAGHSVGEFTVAALAGILTADQAITLVAERGRGMAEASAVRPTSMTAIIGGVAEDVLAAIEAVGASPANNNGKGQIVAAGTVEQLAALAADPPRRARCIPLSVAGAFHTEHMRPALAQLQAAAAEVSPANPDTLVVSNADGEIVDSGQEFLQRLVAQVANPVRWDLCMETMSAQGVSGVLELTPAGTLTGIAKRNLPGVELFNLNTPDQLGEARAFVAQHASTR